MVSWVTSRNEFSFSDMDVIDQVKKSNRRFRCIPNYSRTHSNAGIEDCTSLPTVWEHVVVNHHTYLGTKIQVPYHNDLFDVNEYNVVNCVKILFSIVYDLLG